MSFVADLGGSRLKFAVVTPQGSVGAVRSIAWPDEPRADDWRQLESAFPDSGLKSDILLSSTRPAASARIAQEAGWRERVRLIEPDDVPIPRSTVGTGTDRLLGSWAAWSRSNKACFVLDCGTAWTLDAVDEQGQFRGGAIGAGLGVIERALAGACPHLAAPAQRLPLGLPTYTNEAVAAGTVLHLAVGIETLVSRWGQQLGGDASLFLTGGDAQRVRPHLRMAWQLAPDLVLDGLADLVDRKQK